MTEGAKPPAAARWGAMVEAEHAQSDRVRQSAAEGDFWTPFAGGFRPDLARPDDPQLAWITSVLSPEWTVLDVGAGGGRLSLPLAQRCRHVTAVEPSAAMVGVLREEAARTGTGNLTVIEATWEAADAPAADLVVCVHVVYTVVEIEPFLRNLGDHARERVALVAFVDPPQAQLSPFWPRVHREERLRLPCLAELVPVLWEMGVYPDVTMLPPRPFLGYEDRERAREQLRARLFIQPGTEEDGRLEGAIDELLHEGADGRLVVRGARLQRPGLVTWRPRDASA